MCPRVELLHTVRDLDPDVATLHSPVVGRGIARDNAPMLRTCAILLASFVASASAQGHSLEALRPAIERARNLLVADGRIGLAEELERAAHRAGSRLGPRVQPPGSAAGRGAGAGRILMSVAATLDAEVPALPSGPRQSLVRFILVLDGAATNARQLGGLAPHRGRLRPNEDRIVAAIGEAERLPVPFATEPIEHPMLPSGKANRCRAPGLDLVVSAEFKRARLVITKAVRIAALSRYFRTGVVALPDRAERAVLALNIGPRREIRGRLRYAKKVPTGWRPPAGRPFTVDGETYLLAHNLQDAIALVVRHLSKRWIETERGAAAPALIAGHLNALMLALYSMQLPNGDRDNGARVEAKVREELGLGTLRVPFTIDPIESIDREALRRWTTIATMLHEEGRFSAVLERSRTTVRDRRAAALVDALPGGPVAFEQRWFDWLRGRPTGIVYDLIRR